MARNQAAAAPGAKAGHPMRRPAGSARQATGSVLAERGGLGAVAGNAVPARRRQDPLSDERSTHGSEGTDPYH